MSITRTPRRRRFGMASIVIGAILLAIGLLAPPAQAAESYDFVAGYDVYLHDEHQGSLADGFDNDENEEGADCPDDVSVDGMSGWHFILPGSDHAFDTLDVAFELDGDTDPEILSLTKKTDFTGFDPTLHYMSYPTGKHAYVYTSGDDAVMLLDAAAHVLPDATLDKFVLSHTCPGGGETTDDTTTDDTTTDDTTDDTTTDDTTDSVSATDSVQSTTGSVDTGGTDTEVEGEVVTRPETLPATGAEDRSLALLGIGFVAIGAAFMLTKRAVLFE